MNALGISKTLVLAAGLGSRLASISGGAPKPLVSVAGEPVLGHTLRWLAGQGIEEVILNLHHQPAAVRCAIGDGSRYGVRARFVYEPELLGTAGALANVAAPNDGTLLVVYGDNLLDIDLAALVAAHRRSGAEATLALFDRSADPHTGIAGGRVLLDARGAITAFVEGRVKDYPLVNAGVYLIEPELLELIPRGRLVDFGRDVFPAALREGRRLQGVPIKPGGFCLGLDTPEAYRNCLSLVRDGRVRLAAGARR